MTRTKVRQQAKPTVPVNMKKVNEATSMYPMYSITDTPRVITIFVVIRLVIRIALVMVGEPQKLLR